MEYAHLRNDRSSYTYIIIAVSTQDSSRGRGGVVLRSLVILSASYTAAAQFIPEEWLFLAMVSKSIIKEAVCFLSEFRMVFLCGRRYNRTYYAPVLFRRMDI